MKNVDIIQSIVNLILTVPLWAAIGYFLSRNNAKRDKFEDNASQLLHSLDKRLAIIEKENEFNKILYRNVLDISEALNKTNKDVNLFYARLKTLEEKSTINK